MHVPIQKETEEVNNMKKIIGSLLWIILLFVLMSMFCIGSLAFTSGIKGVTEVIIGTGIASASKCSTMLLSIVCVIGGTAMSFIGCYLFMDAWSYIRTGKGLKSEKESLEAPPAYIIEKK